MATSEWRDSLARSAPHPSLQIGDERRDAGAASREALVGGEAVDLALDVEDRVDALDRLEGERRDDGELAARLGGDVGEHEELAPRMRPAGRLGDRPAAAVGCIEPVEARIGVGLQDPAVAGRWRSGCSPVRSRE